MQSYFSNQLCTRGGLPEALPCLQRSLREAPGLAAAIRDVLARRLPVGETAEAVWDALWPAEKRRQVLASTAVAILLS